MTRCSEPQGGKNVQCGSPRTPVLGGDADQDIVRSGLRVLHKQVEVLVVVEDPVSSSSYSISFRDRALLVATRSS